MNSLDKNIDTRKKITKNDTKFVDNYIVESDDSFESKQN